MENTSLRRESTLALGGDRDVGRKVELFCFLLHVSLLATDDAYEADIYCMQMFGVARLAIAYCSVQIVNAEGVNQAKTYIQ